jgi:pyruvate/oxaloacetate carboxyltransferase
MARNKISKKELREMVTGSMREALEGLQLPKASRKIRKLLDRSAKKIAAEYSDLLKAERKKEKKEKKKSADLTYVEDVLIGKKKARKQALALLAEEAHSETVGISDR